VQTIRGIYEIRNTITGECYIGSAHSILRRWAQHRASLNNGGHYNHRLQQAWDTYGAETFAFGVLEEIAPPHGLEQVEARYIAERRPPYNLGNLAVKPEPTPQATPQTIKIPNRTVTITRWLTCKCCGENLRFEERQHLDAGFAVMEVDNAVVAVRTLPEGEWRKALATEA
jgi:hypothetical protein